jgi:aromatic ring-opening dioxygenase catalytic subunit (LigB family)
MALINPTANIPIIQLSVLSSQSAHDLLALGAALRPLRSKNIAIVGSGSASFHNLRQWMTGGTASPSFKPRHEEWARALDEAVKEGDEKLRQKKLEKWREFPNADMMHPRGASEHFSPLLVCAGAAGEEKATSWADDLMGTKMRSYAWA